MKHFLVAITLLFAIVLNAQDNNTEENIFGIFTQDKLLQAPYKTWYEQEYKYQTNLQTIKKIKKIKEEYSIIVVLGTWCSDSQEQVPRFLKIIDDISFDKTKLTLVGVNHDKKVDNFDIDKYNIERVPTFIIISNNQEIGRITETPENTLEDDLLKILLE